MKKHYVTWDDVFVWITKIENQYHNYTIYGIPKGGMILAGFFSKLKITHNPDYAHLLIDDIIDSGRTQKEWRKKYPNIIMESMFNKQKYDDHVKLGWIVFPWENEKDHEEELERIIQYYNEEVNKDNIDKLKNNLNKLFRKK
jgi:hypoxanthine phosphoribosyltransferase